MILAKRLAEARRKIQAERKRQIEVEGWTEQHDDEHGDGALLQAAVFYHHHAIGNTLSMRADGAPVGWPWEPQSWKPKGRERDLIRAGALCHAERDRLKRAGAQHQHVEQKLRLVEHALAGLRS